MVLWTKIILHCIIVILVLMEMTWPTKLVDLIYHKLITISSYKYRLFGGVDAKRYPMSVYHRKRLQLTLWRSANSRITSSMEGFVLQAVEVSSRFPIITYPTV
jgi:hypothetical protein